MICDKCGKSNIMELSKCKYCGAELPKTSGGGGFADILSYTVENTDVPSCVKSRDDERVDNKSPEGISEIEMQKLIKKSDSIAKSTRTNSFFGLIAVALSILIFISLIVFESVTLSKVNVYIGTTTEKIEELNQELKTYKTQLDAFISEEKQGDKGADADNGQTEGEQPVQSEDGSGVAE